MHIIVELQKKAREGRDVFTKYLKDSCGSMMYLQRNNMFSPNGKKQLEKINKKLLKMKRNKRYDFDRIEVEESELSECCCAPLIGNEIDQICSECKEHSEPIKDE